ncbi:MAG TPA: hypothetical protein VFC58_00205 [Desulfosporosinus sp.]|nr:hypothetical protein [Desulfosporosinus sp.]
MQKLYSILWSLAILLIMVATVVFSIGFILVAAVVVSLFGIYRYYLMKRRSKEFKNRPYTSGEVIDLQAEVIHETITIQDKKRDEF